MGYTIAVLEGDGIGPEIVPEAVTVAQAALEQVGARGVEFVPMPIGAASYRQTGRTLPPETLERMAEMDGFVLGPIGHADYPDDPLAVNPHPIIRRHFDLYANHRPACSFRRLPSLHEDVDLLILRENNEGFQPDRNMAHGSGEFQPNEHNAFSIRVISRRQSERIAHRAFEAARARGHHVTAIHKRTVFGLTDGMFMDTVEEVAGQYPDVRLESHQVDTFALHMTMRPHDYDVVLCTNLYGDILSDLAAGLVGGLGLAPGLSAGDRWAMAQATHGSAPDIAGRGIANPYAMIASVQMLLSWLGAEHADAELVAAARLMQRAAVAVLEESNEVTPDLGGEASTSRMAAAVAAACSRPPQDRESAAHVDGGNPR